MTPMRADSSSIRRIDLARSSWRRFAPRRNSSAYPRIDVRGVRSSCEASARKRRRRSSDALRSAKACSIWASIAFRATPRRPTSVRGSSFGTRCERSPAAMAPAVTPICSRGRSSRRTSHQDRRPRPIRTARLTSPSTNWRRPSVFSTSVRGIATIRTAGWPDGWKVPLATRTRYRTDEPPTAPTVKGSGFVPSAAVPTFDGIAGSARAGPP